MLALSENKLAEEGWAMIHDNIYDVTINDDTPRKCYLYPLEGGNYNVVDFNTKLGFEANSGDINVDEVTRSAIFNDGSRETADECLINENLTYNYFQNSNLSAWKVWYCLDNDKSRFAWADEGNIIPEELISVTFNEAHPIIGTPTSTIIHKSDGDYIMLTGTGPGANYYYKQGTTIGDYGVYVGNGNPADPIMMNPLIITSINSTEPTIIPEGHGVIYRLIDEFNNDIKYDFKNIQFKRKITNGQYDAANGTETWCYTLNVWYNNMCQDASIVGNTLLDDEGYIAGVYDNIFGYATAYDLTIDGVDTFAFALGNNVVLSFDDDGYYGIYSNTIGNGFHNNTIWNNFQNNTIGNYFRNNTIVNTFNSNTIGNNFQDKQISTAFQYTNYGNNGVELATKS